MELSAYLDLYISEYMEKVFYFCLKKCGNQTEAEDLSCDITLQIAEALGKGTVPDHFPAWVWQIARNRYSLWIKRRRKQNENESGTDLTELEIGDETMVEDQILKKEQYALLRRELAFISSAYRDLIVAYYVQNRRVEAIAGSMGLPKGTVLSRLHRSRNLLKEGMNMAREFGTRSYNPEEIDFRNNVACNGKRGQPWAAFEHKLYKNIFLEAYGNPSTAEHLALELGIALPYMEDELAYLTKETYLIKDGDKYETAFPIISKTAQEQIHLINKAAAADIAALMTRLLDKFDEICKQKSVIYYYGQDEASAKWTLLMMACDRLNWKFEKPSYDFSDRPDGGKWDTVGYQIPAPDFKYSVGMHCSGFGNYLRQFKYEFDGICERTPNFLDDRTAELLSKITTGENFDPSDPAFHRLIEDGYLKMQSGKPVSQVLLIEEHPESRLTDAEGMEELHHIAENIRQKYHAVYKKTVDIIKTDLPVRLRENLKAISAAVTCSFLERGYIFEQAMDAGWLPGVDQVCNTVGAHIVTIKNLDFCRFNGNMK